MASGNYWTVQPRMATPRKPWRKRLPMNGWLSASALRFLVDGSCAWNALRKLRLPTFVPLPQFSERRNDVLQWMVEGKRNAEIATILNLSPRTVENHVQEILRELMVENRATAIVRAMEYCAAVNHGMPLMPPAPPV